MLLYATNITSRLLYIVSHIGNHFFTTPIKVTSQKDEFIGFKNSKINYSSERLTPEEFWIRPVNLLFENTLEVQNIKCFNVGAYKAFYQTHEGDFPFDILAASFYLMTRYEEYLPHEQDEFGRYSFSNSLAFKEGFLHRPLVNVWLKELKKELLKKFPELYFNYIHFKFIPTYDIARVYNHVNLGWKENLKADIRAAVKGNWAIIKARKEVIAGKKKDVLDVYEWLDALHLYSRLKPYYFFLVAADPKGFDNNILPTNPALQQLIEYQAAANKVGIHPSWQSGDNDRLIKEEKELLEYLCGRNITNSRQHYLRFSLPDTYRKLIELGIEKDHSMGYGQVNGFRASIASSFYWFDLERNKATNLKIFPFCFMDTNAYYEQKLTVEAAFKQLMQYYSEVKAVHGLMVTVWHNHFLSTDPQFKPWREMYEIFLKEEVYWD